MVTRSSVIVNILITVVFLVVTSGLSYKVGLEEHDKTSFDYRMTVIFLGISGILSGLSMLTLIVRAFLVDTCPKAAIAATVAE
jgi:hypothetical protein